MRAAALVFCCVQIGCTRASAAPAWDVAADGVLLELDRLQARAMRLERRLELVRDAAPACAEACLAGVESLELRGEELLCRRARPRIKVTSSRPSERAAVDRVGSPTFTKSERPPAAAGEGLAVAGPPPGGAP